MNRKCVRCGIIQDSEAMHRHKQMGWLCNDHANCTKRLLSETRGKT